MPKKMLILAGGFGHPRHILDYHIITEYLNENNSYKSIDILVCNSTMNACDFGNPFLAAEKLPFKYFRKLKTCNFCTNSLVSYIEKTNWNPIFLDKTVSKELFGGITLFLNSVTSVEDYSCSEFIKIKYKGIDVGRCAYETYQRSRFVGRVENLNLKSDKYLLELLKTACITVESAFTILNTGKYDSILQNEFSYILWGIFGRVALILKIKVIQIFFKSHPHFPQIFIRENEIDLSSNPFWEKKLLQLYNQKAKQITNDYLIEISEKKESTNITQYYGEQFAKPVDFLELSDEFNFPFVGDKCNVFIFCHLNWDASLSYGDPIFDFFEDWLDATITFAINKTDVNWCFKLHPVEAIMKKKGFWHKDFNTKVLLEKKIFSMVNKMPHNIFILDKNVSTDSIIKVVNVAISSGGSICYQLPQHGIPVINVNRGMHSGFDFTVDINSIAEYVKILEIIEDIPRLDEIKINKAKLYEEFYLNETQYFDTTSLIYNSQNELVNSINSKLLKEWVEINSK